MAKPDVMTAQLPERLQHFVDQAGWGEAQVEPLPGDASFRRYFRLLQNGKSAMLMDSPPAKEDPRPFLEVGRWLADHGHRAPQIYAEQVADGLLLLEDFGADRMRDWLDIHPQHERAVYERAVDTLVALHASPPGPFPEYDLETYLAETRLFAQWYCPAVGLVVDTPAWDEAWHEVAEPLLARQAPGVTVLRDYHAENIMLLDAANPDGAPSCSPTNAATGSQTEPGTSTVSGEQGLIDFQDALVGHRAYDLVSLLQDARRDLSPGLEELMFGRYCAAVNPGPDFAADYARLGAQRNAKIVGIFSRLWRRDGKPRYLPMVPRVWAALERDLEHPTLAPVARWFDANIPPELRAARGGDLA